MISITQRDIQLDIIYALKNNIKSFLKKLITFKNK